MGYTLSRQAEEDIVDIYLAGTERFGIRQAERYHALLEKSFLFLADNPLAARQRDEIVPPVRIHPVGSHLIVYTLDEKDRIFIVRVRHAHEDWQSLTDSP